MKISCIALAGGKSTRLGRNKLAEIIGGKTLFDRVMSALHTIGGEIIVVTSNDVVLPEPGARKLRVVKDLFPGTGSLGAIYTGLAASKTHFNLVVACDMPFLNVDLLRYMVATAPGFDLVAYNKDDRPEPLHAVYSSNCAAPMKSLIEQNRLRIIGVLPFIHTRYLTGQEIERFDPDYLSFFNVNNEEDLQKARAIALNSRS